MGGINAYSISFKKKSEDFGKTQAGWTDSQIVLPTALKARCNKLASQFKPRPHAERQQNANMNRAQFIAERVAKGRAVSFKVDSAKAKRGMMQAEGLFSVNASDANDNDANAGWGVRTRLPKRLHDRVTSLNAKFNNRQPYEVRRQQAFYNRQAFNEHTKQFAKLNAMKAVNAAERRSEFEDNMVIFSNAQPVAIPTKLAERANFLQAKFKKKNTHEERRFNASMNRGKFNLEKSKMAASFSNRTNTVQAQKE